MQRPSLRGRLKLSKDSNYQKEAELVKLYYTYMPRTWRDILEEKTDFDLERETLKTLEERVTTYLGITRSSVEQEERGGEEETP